MSAQVDQNTLEHGADAGRDEGEDSPLLPKDLGKWSSSLISKLGLSFQDWFSWELVSALVALVSVSAIIVVLAIFDNSSLPDWPSIFTVCPNSHFMPPRLSITYAKQDQHDSLSLFFHCQVSHYVHCRNMHIAVEVALVQSGAETIAGSPAV